MRRTPPGIRHLYTLLLLINFLVLAGCSHMDRIVIDGAMALHMEHMVNDQLLDEDMPMRGNTASNIRNGGYILEVDDMLYFIHEMHFPPAETLRYLQEMACCSVGSLTTRNEFIAALNGKLIGSFERFLLFIDEDSDRKVSAIDRTQYDTQVLFDQPVTAALLLDRTVYLSTESGALYALTLGIDLTDSLDVHSRLITDQGGILVGLSESLIHVTDGPESEFLISIDSNTGEIVNRISGESYTDVQVAGSWFYYKEGSRLMRQRLTGEEAVSANIREVEEYGVCGHYLVFTSPQGGIFVSHLDGSGIAQLSDDQASGLQVLHNRMYYRNHFDDQAIYMIDLTTGIRSALIGEMVTDGGIRIVRMEEERETELLRAFSNRIDLASTMRTTRERYNGSLSGPFLFVVLPHEDTPIQLYRYVDEYFSADEVGALVLIRHDNTALGRYTDGAIAYRVDTILTLYDPHTLDALLSWRVQGRPPSEIKTSEGDRYGLLISWHQMALNMMQEVYGIY